LAIRNGILTRSLLTGISFAHRDPISILIHHAACCMPHAAQRSCPNYVIPPTEAATETETVES